MRKGKYDDDDDNDDIEIEDYKSEDGKCIVLSDTSEESCLSDENEGDEMRMRKPRKKRLD